jgi:hypothetical protein
MALDALRGASSYPRVGLGAPLTVRTQTPTAREWHRRPFRAPPHSLEGWAVYSMPRGGTTFARGSTRSWRPSGPTHARCFLDSFALRTGGSEMDTRDKAVSLVGYLLLVATAAALIAGVMAAF